METKAGGQRYLLGIWILISVLTPGFGWLGARGFAPGLALVGLLALPYARPKGRDWISLGLLGLLLAWAMVSVKWSLAPNLTVHTPKDMIRLTYFHMGLQIVLSSAFVIASARLNAETSERALRWLSYCLVAMAFILVAEGLTQAAVYQRMQGLIGESVRPDLAVRNVALGGYVLAVLLYPVGAALWRDRKIVAILFLGAAVLFSTFVLRGDSPTVAVLLAGAVFALVYRFGRPAVLAIMGVVTAYWLATPWAMRALDAAGLLDRINGHLPPSWNRRLEIWSFAVDRWRGAPLKGLGLDASRTFPGYIELHPHDGAIQVWLELGVIGAAVAAAFWALLFWRVAERAGERLWAATACATATVYLVIGAISFGVWQEWWICLGALALAACVALGRFIGQPQWSFDQTEPSKAG